MNWKNVQKDNSRIEDFSIEAMEKSSIFMKKIHRKGRIRHLIILKNHNEGSSDMEQLIMETGFSSLLPVNSSIIQPLVIFSSKIKATLTVRLKRD